jgi:hypothetical protein
MRLNPAAFNTFLGGIGQKYSWRRSYACPCVDPHSGASKPSCPLCFGNGRQWIAPVDGVAGMAGAKTQRDWAQFGVYESGDVVVTIGSDSPMYAMGQFDRVTALNASNQFSVVLTRGEATEAAKLRLITLKSIDRVFWLTTDGTTVVEGGIPAVANGVPTWASGAPPAATQYTISGSRSLEYFCYGDFPSNRNEHSGAPLPKRVVLRDFDLFNR